MELCLFSLPSISLSFPFSPSLPFSSLPFVFSHPGSPRKGALSRPWAREAVLPFHRGGLGAMSALSTSALE